MGMMTNFAAFIDGTGIPICHPTRYQHAFYSGHHHRHEIGFLYGVNCEGLCVMCLGPHSGCRSDKGMVIQEGLDDLWNEKIKNCPLSELGGCPNSIRVPP